MDADRRTGILGRTVLVILLASVLFSLTSAISDPDFFWHLATGRWIWEHRQLPAEDPFSYTTSLKAYEEFFRARIILTQYWLGELVQYGLYTVGGYPGVIVLRLAVILLTLLVTYLRLKGRGLGVTTSALLLIPLSFILIDFKGDRPNQMTFFFLAAFLYLIEALKKRQRRGYFLPLIFVVWANIHGGFILGAAIGIIYLFSEFIRVLAARRNVSLPAEGAPETSERRHLSDDYRPDKRLIIVTAVTVLAGFLNPNGYTVIYSLIKETSVLYKTTVTETLPPSAFIEISGTYRYILLIVLFLVPYPVLVAAKWFRQRQFPLAVRGEDILLLTFFGLLSFTAVRYIPLLAIAVTPLIGSLLVGGPDLVVRRLSKLIIPELLVVACSLWFAYVSYPFSVIKTSLLVDNYYPEEAVRFIRENLSQGTESPLLTKRLMNDYGWGGFLIWNFYPDKVVFIDGRGISQRVYSAYQAVLTGRKEEMMGEPAYKAILDAYSVRYILIPAMGVNGGLSPVIPVLVNDPEWRLIFFSKNCLLFTREKFEPDYAKVMSYGIAIENAFNYMNSRPGNPSPYLTVALSNVALGRKDDAMAFLRDAIQKRPSLRGGPVEKALNLLIEGKDIPWPR